MEIYLIRHGECENSSADYYDHKLKTMNPPLTANGRLQAEKLANRLASIHFDMICTSDLRRAVQTSEIINNSMMADLVVSPLFREIDMGDVHLLSWNAFPELRQKWDKHEEDLAYPNGENGEDVWKRCGKGLEGITSSGCDRAAVVCHGGTIRIIICGALKIPFHRRFTLEHLVNCSISIVTWDGYEFKLKTYNDHAHI